MAASRLLVASFGFDEKFVVRAMTAIRPSKLVAVVLDTGPQAMSRMDKAFHQLSIIAQNLGIKAEKTAIPVAEERTSIARLARKLAEALLDDITSHDEVYIVLTGGPRLLVVALYTMLLYLPEKLLDKVKIVVEGEGFDTRAEDNAREILATRALLAGLSKAQLEVLCSVTNEYLETGRGTGPRPLSRETGGKSHQTIHKHLNRLAEANLLRKEQEDASTVYKPASDNIAALVSTYCRALEELEHQGLPATQQNNK